MLSELRVRDLGVVEDVTLHFGAGMTVLTGETGTGKTLLVEALRLVLGGRPAAGVTRAGADEALVEARFVRGTPRARGLALVDGSEPDADDEVILARSLPTTGRSRAWIDGRMAPVTALGESARGLVDLHGQHDQQSLLTAGAQRDALDAFAGVDLEPLAEAKRRLRDLDARLQTLGGDEHQRARELDVLRHQVNEIDDVAPEDDEEDRLRDERDRLVDVGAHREAAAAALGALEGDPAGSSDLGGANDLLARAVAALGSRGPFRELETRLSSLTTEVADMAADLRHAVDSWEDDPVRLAAVQDRLRRLGDLRRKYGATLSEVLEYAARARDRMAELERAEAAAAELEAARTDALTQLRTAERAVRDARRAAAPELAGAAGDRLRALAMPRARFEIQVGDEGAGDPVTFLLGANPGEPVQPLARVASGGELARAMLALRLEAMEGPSTMVFDEVDAGVGGTAALSLARALAEVAAQRQVLAVTHLAQVAAFADAHVAVTKTTRSGRTRTRAVVLSDDERVVEISRMLSGSPGSVTARAHAEELLEAARARRVQWSTSEWSTPARRAIV